jgi:hypothetical protein
MGWVLINICLPVCAPLGMYLLLPFLPLSRPLRKRINPLLAVKDGQLCWVAIGFCASGLHEATASGGDEWLVGGLVLILVLSSLLACGGALFQTSLQEVEAPEWLGHYRCFIGSGLLTLMAAGLFAVAHFVR